MKLFRTTEAIIAESDSMHSAEKFRREDRQTVSQFFNGEPPLTDQEAEDLGFTINANSLFGYSEISSAKDQLLGLFNKPEEFYTVEFDACPPHARQKWRMAATKAFNEVVKGSRHFKAYYEGICGDASLHGEAVLFHANGTAWCPKHTALSNLLVPDDAPILVDSLSHWGIETTLELRDLHTYAKGDLPGWNTANVKAILSAIYKGVERGGADLTDNVGDNWEALEYQRQTNPGETPRRRPSVKVEYFYQARQDLPGCPVDLTIYLSRNETIFPEGSEERKDPKKRILYETESALDHVDDCIHPFFVDCILGGEGKWHRVLGLGPLNYQLNHAVELLVNRAMQGTLEGMMQFWKAKDSATREELEKILLQHNGIVPEGVELIAQRNTPDFAGAVGMIQMFRQQGRKNAKQLPENADLLEVQAMAMQGEIGQSVSSRTANWYDYTDRLGLKMWGRLVNPFIRPCDPGYSDALRVQAALEREGVPLYYAQPHNVRIRTTRLIGDGDAQKEIRGAAWLAQNRNLFPPQSQQRITRIAAAAMTGSHALATELMPIEEKPDDTQTHKADGENNTCILQGRPPEVSDKDIDELHFPIHLQAMMGMVQRAAEFQNATFTPQDFMGFKALGGHCILHIQKVQTMVGTARGDENKAKAAMWMQGLNEIVSLGEKMAHNMRQAQEQQGQKPDPIDVAKLQIEAQKVQLSMDKFHFSREKWARTQQHKESESSFQRMLALERNSREDITTRNKVATNDVTTAVKLLGSGSSAQ